MADEIAIRPAIVADLDRVLQIEQQAPAAAHWTRAVYEAMVSAEAGAHPQRVLFVAESAGEVAGFAVARAVLTDCDLENIAVSNASLRRGVGRALLLRVCEWSRDRGVSELDAEVRTSNAAALGLYLAAGFVEVGARPSYYSAPEEDARLLKLHL